MIIEITFPVLNEEKRLKKGVVNCIEFLKANKVENFSIVIVDNGSRDRTAEIAKELLNSIHNIRFIQLKDPGVGRALKVSWSSSNADIIGYMDIDLATDLRHLIEVINMFHLDNDNDIDIITGSRLSVMSSVSGRSVLREVLSKSFNLVVRKLLGINFSDGMCGFKFIRRNYYCQLSKYGLINNGWFFATEMLVVAEKQGGNIIEIPVEWSDGGDSRVKVIKTVADYLIQIARLRKRLLKNNETI